MHTFREISAPNVDASRTHLNWTAGAKTSAEVRDAVKALLPDKRRKDAVLCIEYLITASPEWLREAQEKDRIAYFNRAISWLRQRHGKANIVCLNLQRDETSEHLVAYVVPRTTDGRLSAKDFLGGRSKLSAMQTDFWHQVGRPAGLQRGLEGSIAKHTTAKQYSAALSKNPELIRPAQPNIRFSDRVSGRAGRMRSEYSAASDEYVSLIEKARNEAIMMRNARQRQEDELNRLRAEQERADTLKLQLEAVKAENATLRVTLKNQLRDFAIKTADLKAQLTRTTNYLSTMLAILIGKKKQFHIESTKAQNENTMSQGKAMANKVGGIYGKH